MCFIEYQMLTKKNTLKIAFVDGGCFCQKLIYRLLSDKYEFIESNNDPDVIVYSLYGNEHIKYTCKKICVIGENSFPDFNECDYAISPHYINFQRHLRMPFYVFNKEYDMLKDCNIEVVTDPVHRMICGALISNCSNADLEREKIINAFISKQVVCSAGRAFNNVGKFAQPRQRFAENLDNKYTNPYKVQFSRGFKFNLALENSNVDGYCTEKITDIFAAYSVPIYWGCKQIEDEFDPKSFVNIRNFKSADDVVDYIVNMSDDEYMRMLSVNSKCKVLDYYERLKKFLEDAFDGPVFEHRYGNIAFQVRR